MRVWKIFVLSIVVFVLGCTVINLTALYLEDELKEHEQNFSVCNLTDFSDLSEVCSNATFGDENLSSENYYNWLVENTAQYGGLH